MAPNKLKQCRCSLPQPSDNFASFRRKKGVCTVGFQEKLQPKSGTAALGARGWWGSKDGFPPGAAQAELPALLRLVRADRGAPQRCALLQGIALRRHSPTCLAHSLRGSWGQAALPEGRRAPGAFFLGMQTGSVVFEPLLGRLLSV